ncbi:ABC transporter permease [Okibacterium endophyticum]
MTTVASPASSSGWLRAGLRGSRRKRGTPHIALGLAGVLGFLLIWEVSTRNGLVGTSAFPPASQVIAELPVILASAVFWSALGETLLSTVVALVISVLIAIPLGTVIGLSRILYRSVSVTIEFLKPIPVVALLPLALLVFGTTQQMKLSLIIFGTVWPLLIQVIYGVRSVDSVAASTARSFRIGRARGFFMVILPSAAPYIATGLRIAGVGALLLCIVTELVGRAPGLGLEIARAQSAAQFADLYAYVLLTGLLGILVNTLLEAAERRAMHWHVSQRGSTR